MVLSSIVAMTVIMMVISISPVYAAQKVVDEKNTFEFDVPGVFLCDQPVNAHIIEKSHFIYWDNDKYVLKEVIQITATNSIGDIVAQSINTISNVGTFGPDEVKVVSDQAILICTGSGLNSSLHIGITIHKDGTITTHFNP